MYRDYDKVNDTMGVSGKWIKTLVGLRKSEKPESSEKDGNVNPPSDASHHHADPRHHDSSAGFVSLTLDPAPPRPGLREPLLPRCSEPLSCPLIARGTRHICNLSSSPLAATDPEPSRLHAVPRTGHYHADLATKPPDANHLNVLTEIKKSLINPNGNLRNWNKGDPCTSN